MLPYQTISQKDNGIAIVGIGGAGANVLQCFGSSSADHVRLYTMSLDERVGRACGNVEFIQLGEVISHGLGSGGDPEVGRRAMEESAERMQSLLSDCKLLVMVVGLGGGTGSGAAPVLARMAREAGLFLVSVIMMPFTFEGKRRREQAEHAQEEIARLSDIVFCFENDYMEELFRNRSGARAVFEEVDRLLAKATASVPMMATSPGLINLGLDELATALENHDSRCIFGSGSGYGAKRAEQAARAAVSSPLATYHGALQFAKSVIVHIAGGESMSLTEIRQAMEVVREALGSEDVAIFFGATVKAHLGDEMRITLIASIDAGELQNAIEREAEEAAAEAAAKAEAEAAEKAAAEAEAKDEEPESEPEILAEIPEEENFVDEEEEFYPAAAEEPAEEPEEPETEDEPAESREPVEETEAAAPEAPAQPLPPAEPKEEKPAEPTPFAEPKASEQAPQQLDLFSAGPMRQSDPDSHAPAHRGRDLPPTYPLPQGNGARGNIIPPVDEDDIDTPPSLRFNDLRNIFPDN